MYGSLFDTPTVFFYKQETNTLVRSNPSFQSICGEGFLSVALYNMKKYLEALIQTSLEDVNIGKTIQSCI